MRKKRMRLTALLLALVFGVCGCANDPAGKMDTDSVVEDCSTTWEMEDEDKDEKIKEYVKPEMKGEITVSCFMKPEFLETAAKQFMDKYSDVTVTINDYAQHLDMPSEHDYQVAFNTKLMSGDAEDIIFNFCLPISKYSEMGAFEDLSTFIGQTPEMNDETYYMNVLNAARNKDGKIFIIPYKASIATVGFSTELLKEHGEIEHALQGKKNIRFSEAADFAEQLAEGKSPSDNVFLLNEGPVGYTEAVIRDSLDLFLNQETNEVHIDTAEYIDLLHSVKELADEGWFDSDDVDFYNTKYDFAVYEDMIEMQAAAYSVDPQSSEAYTMPLVDQHGNLAIRANNGSIAINHSSEHKELAWEFIKYLLSDEIQSLPSVYGLSVNRRGFEASVERGFEGFSGSQEDYRKLLVNWMEQVNAFDLLDESVVALLHTEHKKFFEGKQSAEETAKTLQRQVEQYFNE